MHIYLLTRFWKCDNLVWSIRCKFRQKEAIVMFRIVTDTSSNLPTAYLQAENITVIPFTFHTESGEQSCMDTASFDAKAFYTAMRNGEKVTTSQIPPHDPYS